MRNGTTGRPARPGSAPGFVLVLLGLAVAVGTLAVAWAPAVGDGRHEVCTSRGAPYSPPHESWRVAGTASAWPIGVVCTWTEPGTGDVVRQEPAWAPTVVAGTLTLLGCGWFAAAAGSRVTGAVRRVRAAERRAGSGRVSP
ncbi:MULTISPECIES: hypothetical protein [unclassified Blastococcus]